MSVSYYLPQGLSKGWRAQRLSAWLSLSLQDQIWNRIGHPVFPSTQLLLLCPFALGDHFYSPQQEKAVTNQRISPKSEVVNQ